MSTQYSPKIVTDGLVLALDSGNTKSIPLDPTVNLKNFSQDFTSSGGGYSLDQITATTSFLAPDRTSTATLFTENTASAVHRLSLSYLAPTVPLTLQQGKYYTLSVSIKSNGRPRGESWFESAGGRAGVFYDLSAGTVSQYSLPLLTSSITPEGDGWYRISYTTQETASYGITVARFYNEAGSGNYTGNGLSGSYIWGLQIEQNTYQTVYTASVGNILGKRTSWTNLTNLSQTASLASSSISSSIPQFSSLGSDILTFDGTGSYALLARPVQDDFTLSCWFKTTQGGGVPTQWYNGRGLVDCEMSGYQNDFGLAIGGGRVIFGVGDPNPPNDISIYSPQTCNDGRWHQAVATRTKSTGIITLYIDSILTASGSAQTGSLTAASSMRIGSLQTGLNYFLGDIGPVYVYNRVLSQAEILQNYNATKTRFGL